MDAVRRRLVRRILRQHLGQGDERRLAASQVARYVSSPFAFYCDLFAPEDQRDPDSELLVMRRERGYAYEEEMIEFDTETISYENMEEGFRYTIEMMAAGEPVILQGLLISKPAGMAGIPDELRKVHNAKSIFGNYRYRVVEVKSQFNLTAAHKIQTAYYNQLLGYIQNVTPQTFTLINGRKEETLEKFNHWDWQLHNAIADARLIMDGLITPEPTFGETPHPWRTYGDKVALATQSLTYLWQIGRSRSRSLAGAGYATFEDIAEATVDELAKIPGMDRYVAAHVIPQAKAILADAPIFKRPVMLPDTRAEVFWDMENINEGLDALLGSQHGFFNYLIGVVIRSNNETRYIPFFAENATHDKEKGCWHAFCELITSLDSPIIYYWGAAAEPVFLRKMAARHGIESSVKNILDRSIDLCRKTTDFVAFPSTGYGLKGIANYLQFDFRFPDYDGFWAMTQYHEYTTSKAPGIRNEILEYNEEDCRATMFIKDWLIANSP